MKPMSQELIDHFEHQDGDAYIVGHKFGMAHHTVHWVKNTRARRFENATTHDKSRAVGFNDLNRAYEHIYKKITKWNKGQSDYSYWAVVKNIRTGKECHIA